MPLTPAADLPIARISFSLNLIAMPPFVVKIMSSSPEVFTTFFSASPLSSFMAIIPLFLTFSNSSKEVFLIVPFLVTITRYFAWPDSLVALGVFPPAGVEGTKDKTFSSFDISKKFKRPRPRATLAPSGIS